MILYIMDIMYNIGRTMLVMNATEVQNNFGKVMNAVGSSDGVEVTKHGEAMAVIISFQEYKKLQEFEDQYWIAQAKKASKKGYLSAEASEDFLEGILQR